VSSNHEPLRRTVLQAGVALCAGAVMAPSQAQSDAAGTPSPASEAVPPELMSLVPGARMAGEGRFRYFGLHIYDTRLWRKEAWTGDDYPTRPFGLELVYARELSGTAIAERSIEEMRRVGPFSTEQSDAWLKAMRAAFPDVRSGDRLMGVHRPGAPTRFFLNAQPTREVGDAEFARLFFGIWLSSRTSAPALRRALLGGAG